METNIKYRIAIESLHLCCTLFKIFSWSNRESSFHKLFITVHRFSTTILCYIFNGVPDGVSLLHMLSTMKHKADAGKYRDEDVQLYNYKLLFFILINSSKSFMLWCCALSNWECYMCVQIQIKFTLTHTIAKA